MWLCALRGVPAPLTVLTLITPAPQWTEGWGGWVGGGGGAGGGGGGGLHEQLQFGGREQGEGISKLSFFF